MRMCFLCKLSCVSLSVCACARISIVSPFLWSVGCVDSNSPNSHPSLVNVVPCINPPLRAQEVASCTSLILWNSHWRADQCQSEVNAVLLCPLPTKTNQAPLTCNSLHCALTAASVDDSTEAPYISESCSLTSPHASLISMPIGNGTDFVLVMVDATYSWSNPQYLEVQFAFMPLNDLPVFTEPINKIRPIARLIGIYVVSAPTMYIASKGTVYLIEAQSVLSRRDPHLWSILRQTQVLCPAP